MHATSVWSKENLPPRTKGALQPGSLWRDVPNHRCTWSVAGMRRDVPNLACYCHHPLGAFPSPYLTIRFKLFAGDPMIKLALHWLNLPEVGFWTNLASGQWWGMR